MKPKVAEIVPSEAWELLDQIRQVIDALPVTLEAPSFILGVRVGAEVATSNLIPNCHEIARGIAELFPVDVHDGYVKTLDPSGKERHHEHSWLTLKDGDPRIIIDPWPLGSVGGPTIFIQDYAFYFGPECSFLIHRSERFLVHTDVVIEAMRTIHETLWPSEVAA